MYSPSASSGLVHASEEVETKELVEGAEAMSCGEQPSLLPGRCKALGSGGANVAPDRGCRDVECSDPDLSELVESAVVGTEEVVMSPEVSSTEEASERGGADVAASWGWFEFDLLRLVDRAFLIEGAMAGYLSCTNCSHRLQREGRSRRSGMWGMGVVRYSFKGSCEVASSVVYAYRRVEISLTAPSANERAQSVAVVEGVPIRRSVGQERESGRSSRARAWSSSRDRSDRR